MGSMWRRVLEAIGTLGLVLFSWVLGQARVKLSAEWFVVLVILAGIMMALGFIGGIADFRQKRRRTKEREVDRQELARNKRLLALEDEFRGIPTSFEDLEKRAWQTTTHEYQSKDDSVGDEKE